MAAFIPGASPPEVSTPIRILPLSPYDLLVETTTPPHPGPGPDPRPPEAVAPTPGGAAPAGGTNLGQGSSRSLVSALRRGRPCEPAPCPKCARRPPCAVSPRRHRGTGRALPRAAAV